MLSMSPRQIHTNVLSGLTVALAMVPEAVAFALIAQVCPLTGLDIDTRTARALH